MTQCIFDNLRRLGFLQHTGATSLIQLLIQVVEAQLVEFVQLLPRVRFGMTTEPSVALGLQ
jgi:hypothetical protein